MTPAKQNGSDPLHNRWNRFLQECELCRHYQLFDGFSAKNPVLDAILPSLLHVKAVAILDEALVEYLNINGIQPPKNFGNTLFGRMRFLAEQGALLHANEIHQVRDRRNNIAHESERTINWQTLNDDVAAIEAELAHLGFVGARPNYEFYASRSRSPDVDDPDIAMVIDCQCGIKVGDEPVLEVSWKRNVYRIGRSTPPANE